MLQSWWRTTWRRAVVASVVTTLFVVVAAEAFPFVVAPALLLILPLTSLCDDDVPRVSAAVDVATSVAAFVFASSILIPAG